MSYYAEGEGTLVLKDGCTADMVATICGAFEVDDDPWEGDVGLNYDWDDYNEEAVQQNIAELAKYVKSGDVVFRGEDSFQWRFHFADGKVQEQNGRIIYEPAKWYEKHIANEELVGTLLDIVEDFLERRGFTPDDFPNDDREEDNPALLIGIDAAELMDNFKELLTNKELIKEDY